MCADAVLLVYTHGTAKWWEAETIADLTVRLVRSTTLRAGQPSELAGQLGGMLVFHMPAQKLSPEIIQAAIEGFEAQKSRIDAQIAQLRQMLDGDRPKVAAPSPAPQRRKRRLSAAGR